MNNAHLCLLGVVHTAKG